MTTKTKSLDAVTLDNGAIVKLGDVFVYEWGYNQTNITFYRVVSLTPKSAVVREVESRRVESDKPYHRAVVPGDDLDGPPNRVLLKCALRVIPRHRTELAGEPSSQPIARFKRLHGTAFTWDGSIQYETLSAYGH